MKVLKDVFSKTKVPFVVWLGLKSFVVIDHPDDIETVMNSNACIEKSDLYNFFNRGVGLFTAPGNYFLYLWYRFKLKSVVGKPKLSWHIIYFNPFTMPLVAKLYSLPIL